MEVMSPIHTMNLDFDFDFDFNSARSTPYPSAPSTPRRIGEYYSSAPSSPSRLTEFYREFDEFLSISNNNNKIGTKSYEDDFAFDVGEEVITSSSVSAEELFDGGMIKPMKPRSPTLTPPRSPLSHGKRMIMSALSPRNKKDTDPSESTTRKGKKPSPERERGRERSPSISSSSRRATRSLSPLRVSQYPWEEEEHEQSKTSSGSKPSSSETNSNSSALVTSSSSSKGHKKWRLKDFFLFRSASEGRGSTDKDPLRKYTALFRRIDSGSSPVSNTKRRTQISAHELHYTTNRAAKEELKKKTFLPYKQGILGRLAIHPTYGFPSHK